MWSIRINCFYTRALWKKLGHLEAYFFGGWKLWKTGQCSALNQWREGAGEDAEKLGSSALNQRREGGDELAENLGRVVHWIEDARVRVQIDFSIQGRISKNMTLPRIGVDSIVEMEFIWKAQ